MVRRIAHIAWRVSIGVAVALVVLVLLLQIQPVRTGVVNAALSLGNPYPDASLTVRSTSGTVLTSLGLSNLELVRSDGSVPLQLEHLDLRYRLLPALIGRIHITELTVGGVSVQAVRDSSGVLDLLAPFILDPDAPTADLTMDSFIMERAALSVSDTSGLWAVSNLGLVLRDLRTKPALAMRLDTLYGDLFDPIAHLPGRVSASGEIADGGLRVDTLLYATSRSQVSASGELARMLRFDEVSSFQLRVAPLHFDDVRPLLPDLIPGGTAVLEAEVSGEPGQTMVSFRAQAGSGSLSGQLSVSTSLALDSRRASLGQLRFREVDPSQILTSLAESGPAAGSVDFDLSGPDWRHLSGGSSLSLDYGVIQGVTVSNLFVEQSWQGGLVQMDGTALINTGHTEIEGTINPGEPDLPLALSANLRDWPIEAWVEAVSGSGSVSGSGNVSVSVEGSRDDLRFSALVDGSVVGECLLDGVITGSLTGGLLSSQLDLTACDGRLDGSGTYSTESGEWRLHSLVASEIDVSQVLGDTTASGISANITGIGLDGDSELDLALGYSFFGPYSLDSLRATATLSADLWQAQGALFSGPGAADFMITGDVDGTRIDSLAFDRFDLAHTATVPGLDTALSGLLVGVIGEDESRIDLTLRPSRINGQMLEGGSSTASLRGDSLVARGSIRLAGAGGIDWSGHANTSSGVAVLDTLGFSELNIEALSPRVSIRSRLTGAITGRIGPQTQRGSLVLEPGGTLNGLPLGGGGALFSMDADSVWTRARLLLGDGVLRLEAGMRPHSERFGGRLDLSHLDAVRLAGVDTIRSSLSGTIRFSGQSLDPDSAIVEIEVDSLRFGFGEVRVDSMAGSLRWESGVIASESIEIHGTPVRGRFSGRLPLTGEAPDERYALTGELQLDDVSSVAAAFGIQVGTSGATFRIRGSGRRDHLQLSTTGTLSGLRWGDIHVARSDLLLSLELDSGLVPSAAELRLEGRVLSLPGITAEKGEVLLTLSSDTLTASVSLMISENRTISMDGFTGRDLAGGRIESFEAQLDDARWSLVAPADILFEDGIEISGFLAVADSQRIALGGYVGTTHGDDLFLSATNVKLDAILDVVGMHDFGATVDARVSMTSPNQEAEPTINGTLSGSMTYEDQGAGEFRARMAFADRRLSIDAGIDHASGPEATIRGYLPLTLSGADLTEEPVSVALEADLLPIDWTRAFLDPHLIDRLEGNFSGTLSVRGTHGDPSMSGIASLTEGRIGLPDLGKARRSLVYEKAAVYLSFHDDVVRVDSASVRSGGGKASATGSVELHNLAFGQMDIDVVARDFLVIDSEPYRAIIAARMNISGTTREPELGGSVRVAQADFRLTDETSAAAFEPVTLSRSDLLNLEERFGIRVTESDTTNFDFYEALEINDLSIELARNSWLRSPRNPAVDIQFTGSLNVTKAAHADIQVFGVIDVVTERSQIEQFGRRFDIQQGSLTFNGPPEQPSMDIGAVYRVRSRGSEGDEVTITLEASGFADDLTISFQSDPVMELSDIVSYIATGRPASESLQLGATSTDDYLRSAAGLAVGPITSLVENLAGAGLGLDVVKIEQDEIKGLTLTAGKYVSPRLFVSVSQPISLSSSSGTSTADATQVAMEYEIIQNLLVSLLSRGTILKANLRWERSF